MAGAGEAFPATVFEQVHPAMGDRVRAYALAALGDVEGRTVWDLYAGIGETTAALARAGASVESVESDRRAVARSGGARRPAARRHAGRVEDVLRRAHAAPDLVITNPPRTGMDARVTEALERLRAGPWSTSPATRPRWRATSPPAAVPDDRGPGRSTCFPRPRTSRPLSCWSALVKYFVTLVAETIEVEVDGEQVTVGGRTLTASLGSSPGTPVRQLLLDGRPRRWRVEAPGPGPLGPRRRGERLESR